MTGFQSFGILLVIAVMIWVVMSRYATPEIRAAWDRAVNRRAGMTGADVVSRLGESAEPQVTLGRTTRTLTVGVRAISVVAVGAMLYVLNVWRDSPESIIPPEYFWECYTVTALLAGWYMAYIMTYQIEREGHDMIIPTWGLGRRAHDLRGLIRIEDDGQYLLRLYFEDGSKAEIMKHVTGRGAFMADLEGYLPS